MDPAVGTVVRREPVGQQAAPAVRGDDVIRRGCHAPRAHERRPRPQQAPVRGVEREQRAAAAFATHVDLAAMNDRNTVEEVLHAERL
jgi:hypothetical protein